MWVFISSVVDHWLTLCFVSSFAIPAYREWPRLIKHKLEVCLQWRGTMAKRLCENPNAIIRKCPYCQAACAENDFQAYHECCTICFIHRCPIYVCQACIRSCMIWDPCQTCKIPGSNQTEPRTSRYQQLATSANLTQAPKHSLHLFWSNGLVHENPATWTVIDTCWLPGSPGLWYSSSSCHCYALPALWRFHAALPGGLEPLERTCESFPICSGFRLESGNSDRNG